MSFLFLVVNYCCVTLKLRVGDRQGEKCQFFFVSVAFGLVAWNMCGEKWRREF